MGVLFNQDRNPNYLFTRTSDGADSANLTGTAAFDFFANNAGVNAAVYIGALNMQGTGGEPNPASFRNIKINVGTAVVASSITIRLEYFESQASGAWSYTTGWKDYGDVTSYFTSTGAKEIPFVPPLDWEMAYSSLPLGLSSLNTVWVRFRITAVSGISEGGANATTALKVGDNAIELTGYKTGTTPFDITDIYDADVAGSWGVVSKTGDRNYVFQRCGLRCGNAAGSTAGYGTLKNAKIQFYGLPIGNAICATNGILKFGELNSEDFGQGGCALSFLPRPNADTKFSAPQVIAGYLTGDIRFYDTKLYHPYSNNTASKLDVPTGVTGHGNYSINIQSTANITFQDAILEDAYALVSNTNTTNLKRLTIVNPNIGLRTEASPATVLSDMAITKAVRSYFMASNGGTLTCKNITTDATANPTYAIWIYSLPAGGATINLINLARTDYNTYFQVAGTVNYKYEADVNVKNTGGSNLQNVKVGFWDYANANVVWADTDASGNITQQQLLNKVITAGAAVPTFTQSVAQKTPHTFKVMDYAYQYFKVSKNANKAFADGIVLTADPYVTLSETNANALTGISINWSTKVITVSGTRTIKELYDYCKAQNKADATKALVDQPITTSDGVNFALNGFTMTITGSVTGLTEVLTGTKTISTGGFFEDRTGAIKNISGTLHYGSRIGYNIKALTGGANIAGAIVAHIDASGNDRTYNTSWTNGALTTDASGNVEGYAVWKVGATEYTSHNLQVGEYNYNWLSIPKTVTGSAINETQRLVTDSQVTLTKANALLVSGIAVTAGSTNIDLSDELLSPAYDNLKARQAAVATIEAGVKGYMNYYSYGLLISKDGTTFTLKDGWDFDNWSTIETGTFRGGQLNFDTADTYSLNFYDNDFNFTTAGTYDFRNATTTGTITLDQTGDVAITAQFHPDATLVNNDETYITVEASVAIQILINGMTAGSRYQVYDVTNDTELENGVTVTGAEDLNYTYSTPTTVRLRVMYVDGLNADEWVEVTGLTSATGLSFNVNPEADLVYEANAVNGSTVTECSVSGATILIYLDDPDGLTSWQRIYAWYRYYLSTEAGIREQNGAYITMPTQTLIQFDTNVLQINNQSASPLIISGANIITDSGDINDAFDYAGSTGSINNNPDIVVPFVYASETVNVWNEPPTAVQIRQEVDTNSTKLASILEDTGTSLPADIAGVTGGLTVEENAKLMGLKNANLLVGKKIL